MEYEKVWIGWKNYEEVLKQWKVLAKERRYCCIGTVSTSTANIKLLIV